jgi:hypothetical protein
VSVFLGQRNAATHLRVSAPASVTAGASFTITVTALTAGNQMDCNYTGTVTFTSSDSSAMLPAAYHFTLADGGTHTFTVTLNTTGTQTLTATDKAHKTIKGKVSVTVHAAGAVPPPAPGRSSRTAPASAPDTAAVDSLRQVVSAEALAALLAEDSLRGMSTNPYPLPTTATVAGSPTFRAGAAVTGTLPARLPVRAGAALALPADEDGVPLRLRRADREAFFAVEAFVPSEG